MNPYHFPGFREPQPPPPVAGTHLAGVEPGTTLCGIALRHDSSFRVTRRPGCPACRLILWETARRAVGEVAGCPPAAEAIMSEVRELLGEPYPVGPAVESSTGICAVCAWPTEAHCDLDGCPWQVCGHCGQMGRPGLPAQRWVSKRLA